MPPGPAANVLAASALTKCYGDLVVLDALDPPRVKGLSFDIGIQHKGGIVATIDKWGLHPGAHLSISVPATGRESAQAGHRGAGS
jgi:hypothetical protein